MTLIYMYVIRYLCCLANQYVVYLIQRCKSFQQGDIAQWQSIRLQIERSLVRTRVSPYLLPLCFLPSVLFTLNRRPSWSPIVTPTTIEQCKSILLSLNVNIRLNNKHACIGKQQALSLEVNCNFKLYLNIGQTSVKPS